MKEFGLTWTEIQSMSLGEFTEVIRLLNEIDSQRDDTERKSRVPKGHRSTFDD